MFGGKTLCGKTDCNSKLAGILSSYRLSTDTFRDIIECLKKVFIHSAQPTVQWSLDVAAPLHVPNSVAPNQPLGVLIKVQGGVGRGQVLF